MNEIILNDDIIRILLVLVVGTTALIITQRSLNSLFSIYAVQSLLLAIVALVLFVQDGTLSLLFIALLTLVSKVIIIPLFLRRLLRSMSIKRDLQFRYLTPFSSIILSTALLFLVYQIFSKLAAELHFDSLFVLGAVIGISMALMGMMIIFSRRKIITKIIGYLTMENGVLIFSVFVADLPFVIEVLIVIDLLMIMMLATVLAFGIDSSIEAFHERLRQFGMDFED